MTTDREDLAYRQAVRYAEELRDLYERDRQQREELRRKQEKVSAVNDMLRGGLRMVFQPIVDLRDGRLTGMEALARFDGDGTKGPDVWFRDAAEVGLGTELELAAISLAIESFDRAHLRAYLSLNLSPETAVSPRFLEAFDGRRLGRVVIEVTEHARVNDYDQLADGLSPFRAEGGRLAVDDAGAGFASLRHILALGPDIIKLDIALTRNIDSDRARRALATALISFAEKIGAVMVAEGIETQAELETLRSLGVSFGQGYYLGRPAPLPPD